MATTTKRLTLPELIERYPADWNALSEQQTSFLIEYIVGGVANGKYDARAAARIAYPNVEKIGIWANRLLVNPRVASIIRLHQGMSEAEVLLADVKALVKKVRRSNTNPVTLVAPLLQLAAALKAYIAKENVETSN